MHTEILWVAPTCALLLGYLLGSIPFGVLLTRFAGAGDLRSIGSGNIGATNVLRTGRKGLAAATLLLDLLKGAAAVWLADWLFPGDGVVAAAAAFIGHCYPVWLRFRGGKGVATMMGIVLALHWPMGLVYALVWLGLLATVRISSVAGMAAAVSAPVSGALFGRFDIVMLVLALAAIVLWKHAENIERLIAGTEPRIGRKDAIDEAGALSDG
ncbi:glycerol-3-phosphate 1-O-acyltransferase PlsY [Sphingomonadaceae bacterium OTU29MARTA1]|uniref:glycerol-3-phosphate 1-O-acyltransferase PlsY n=1 Tax=Sphingomonas sp. Leaf37 TaxID=2876552 RepID=UPI001E2F2499|nr:glycerol-3-phosphate 1-O-acyltransferase PlsY [Sphingomonas sp. Leaf37]USU06942.1 glycerol-3-phosphate 1-O-acyltransferase PlsY [Sphingomonadaceae bacterium OTU29LAMAA1]USU10251.1 glycerol-3-phosphate 1-O-acyltransferase PlsY [Sphingomonadaceae bacterium OTU29MARTA1]USU13698.1 glycerol-3-phosphate 1-O-acyltransferase PlsY [Sphingomonadaceae bacterium OTU29THOMA1]